MMDIDVKFDEKLFAWSQLPAKLLLRIFQYLNPQDINNARLVCKCLNEICSWPEFEKFFVFVIKECVISPLCPPWTILMNSNRKFLNLKLGNDVIFGSGLKKGDADSELWKKLGESVEWLWYNRYFDKCETMEYFGKLKYLACSDHYVGNKVITVPETLEQLHINKNNLETLKGLKESGVLKQLKVLSADGVTVYPHLNFKKNSTRFTTDFYNAYEWFKVDDINLILVPGVNLLNTNCIKADQVLKIVQNGISGPHDTVALSNYRNIGFPNIEEIEVLVLSRCFFYHEDIGMPSVKKIIFKFHGRDDYSYRRNYDFCDDCIYYLIESCPNADSWHICAWGYPLQQISEIFQLIDNQLRHLCVNVYYPLHSCSFDCPKLETLSLTLEQDVFHINSRFPSAMPNLTKIKIESTIKEIPFDQLLKFIEKTPNVEEAHLVKVSMKEIKAIQSFWQKIKKITWIASRSPIDEQELIDSIDGKGFKQLVQLGPLHSNKKSKEYGIQLFAKIPTLRDSYLMDYFDYCVAVYNVKIDEPRPVRYDSCKI